MITIARIKGNYRIAPDNRLVSPRLAPYDHGRPNISEAQRPRFHLREMAGIGGGAIVRNDQQHLRNARGQKMRIRGGDAKQAGGADEGAGSAKQC